MNLRLILVVVAVLLIVGLYFVLRPHSSADPAHRTFAVSIRGDTMKPEEMTVTQDDTVTLRVTANRTFELHLHGYDRKLELRAGHPATLTFKANATGHFDIENEDSSTELGALVVQPR